MQLALYRAERPEVFEDIIGQKHIVRILQNQIKTGTVSQAYLFTGTHGTGKTSTARILAKALNCTEAVPNEAGGFDAKSGTVPCGECENCKAIKDGKFVDVIELDAASNNGVDDIRAITDLVKYPPTVGRYKVYIIDEVHMLSQGAENAFLKTLEEPPEYAIFILATTDPQKVRATIRSRCMQLNFRRVSEDELIEGMRRICVKKGIDAADDALGTIASRADGSVRDALSLLEQCMAGGDKQLDKSTVLEYTGAAGEDFYLALTDAVESKDLGKALLYIDEIIRRGKDAKQILKDWLEHYRNLMVVKYVKKAERVVSASPENIERLRAQAAGIDNAGLEKAIRLLSEYINLGRFSDRPRILLETAAVRLSGTDAAVERSEVGTLPKLKPAAKPAAAAKSKPSQPDTDPLAAIASAVEEDEEEEPLMSFPSAPREQAGDAADMWERIVGEISRTDGGFGSLVGRHSEGESFDNAELVVRIKKNKYNIAEEHAAEITEAAKSLYGREIYVTMVAGDIEKKASDRIISAAVTADAVYEADADEVMNEDDRVNDLTEDISSLFGISPEVLDK